MISKALLSGAGLFCLAAVASSQDVNVPGDYTSIQEAIDNVGPGGTVFIGPGTYTESLLIDPGGDLGTARGQLNMTLEATAPGVVIQWAVGAHALPAAATSSNGTPLDYVLLAQGVTSLTLVELEFDGLNDTTTGMLSCGIVLLESSALIDDCFVHDFQDSPTGWIQNGIGVRVEDAVSSVELVDCSLTNIQYSHVSVVHGATTNLTGCQMIGRGPTASLPQHGVIFGGPGAESGAGGEINDCYFEGFWFTGGTWQADGVLSYESGPVSVKDSVFQDCQFGVHDYANPISVTTVVERNEFTQLATYTTGILPSGVVISDGDPNNSFTIKDNKFNDHAGPGLILETDGGTIVNNYFNTNGTAAGGINCQDDGTGVNVWLGNTYTDFRLNAGWPSNFLIYGAASCVDWNALGPAEATLFGFNNVPGSMMLVSGRPAVGTTFTMGVDNPLGTQTANACLGLFMFSPFATPFYPDGVPVPGLGMDGGSGELLIDTGNIDFAISAMAGLWTGPGSPVTYTLMLPNDPFFVGLTYYCQGVLYDTSPTATIKIGVARAINLSIGY